MKIYDLFKLKTGKKRGRLVKKCTEGLVLCSSWVLHLKNNDKVFQLQLV